MPRHNPAKSAVEWHVLNALVQSLKYANANYILIRYEDLVSNPHELLTQIAIFVGERQYNINFCNNQTVKLGMDHTVSGNPMRFQQGSIEVRSDTEWEENMTQKQNIL